MGKHGETWGKNGEPCVIFVVSSEPSDVIVRLYGAADSDSCRATHISALLTHIATVIDSVADPWFW